MAGREMSINLTTRKQARISKGNVKTFLTPFLGRPNVNVETIETIQGEPLSFKEKIIAGIYLGVSHLAQSISEKLSKFKHEAAVAAVGAGFIFSGLPKNADAAVMLQTGTTLPGQAYIDKGTQVSGGRDFEFDGHITANGTPIQGNAIRINDRFLLTFDLDTHVSGGPVTGDYVRSTDGTNQTWQIAKVIKNPNGLDANLIEISQGATNLTGPDLKTALPPAYRSEIWVAGVGPYALEDEQTVHPSDLNIRGFDMLMDNFTVEDPVSYAGAFVIAPLMNRLTLPGGPWTGYSGCLVEDLNGDAIGMTKSSAISTGSDQNLNFLMFTPQVTDWISQNSQVPEPCTIGGIMVLGGIAMVLRPNRGNEKGSGRFILNFPCKAIEI